MIRRGAHITLGLTESDLEAVEDRYGFTFARQHRLVLSIALPVAAIPERPHPVWPNCREPDKYLHHKVAWPYRRAGRGGARVPVAGRLAREALPHQGRHRARRAAARACVGLYTRKGGTVSQERRRRPPSSPATSAGPMALPYNLGVGAMRTGFK